MQRGLGWTLREMRNVYPAATIAWLKKHVRAIGRIAFTVAIEKLDTNNIAEINQLRKLR